MKGHVWNFKDIEKWVFDGFISVWAFCNSTYFLAAMSSSRSDIVTLYFCPFICFALFPFLVQQSHKALKPYNSELQIFVGHKGKGIMYDLLYVKIVNQK